MDRPTDLSETRRSRFQSSRSHHFAQKTYPHDDPHDDTDEAMTPSIWVDEPVIADARIRQDRSMSAPLSMVRDCEAYHFQLACFPRYYDSTRMGWTASDHQIQSELAAGNYLQVPDAPVRN